MGEHDDEELQRAFRMSLQPVPDAKRSKPRENATASSPPAGAAAASSFESAEAIDRRLQREVLAAAAEQRWTRAMARSPSAAGMTDAAAAAAAALPSPSHREETSPAAAAANSNFGAVQETMPGTAAQQQSSGSDGSEKNPRGKRRVEDERQQLPYRVAEQLYTMVFGKKFSKEVVAQWCNQGFRFSSDSETSLGLVQREGGPCGVLAPIQALVLKYLLFVAEDDADAQLYGKTAKSSHETGYHESNRELVYSDAQKTRALVRAIGEALWRAGGKMRAVLVVLDIPDSDVVNASKSEQEEALERAMDGVALDSLKEFQRLVRVYAVPSIYALHCQLRNLLPAFRSRLGAILLLFSVLLSRGLDAVQSDRDDPEQPLVTPPFGHASQEIVNLVLCGQAVPNVFDGNMDLGGGMCLKGIPTNVEVGFLTLLESLNLCKVGQRLKRPMWPIWVVGSESHYTVLFALTTTVQDESDIEGREAQIRQAFDAQDQSGGGGFISLEALQQLLSNFNIDMPQDMFNNLCSNDIVVWNDFWQCLCQLDTTKGGLKDNSVNLGKKYFDLLHFNGIAKTVATVGNGMFQRPKLTVLRVCVPPKWKPESALSEGIPDTNVSSATKGTSPQEEAPQHAPLVDCIRTRWQRATCNWSGDNPSIV